MTTRRRPELIVRVPLEGHGRITFDADSHENELRLRRWIRHSHVLEALPDLVAQLLDDLDRHDRRDAA
jgi:hypothetical protein